MDIKDCLPHLLYQFKSEQELFEAISEVSKKFTVNRENISDYLQDERLVSAYTIYYLLTNIPKFQGILEWLPESFVKTLKYCTFIDMGAGPGTYSFAFKTWSKSERKIYQVELSEFMKKQARLLWNGFFAESQLIQNIPHNILGPSVMFFGHSANEMEINTTLRYIEKVNPTHIIFLEPGTKDFFKKMLVIRNKLLTAEWNQVYPCSSNESCPMEGKDDWCHQYLHHVHSDELERVGQIVGINRRFMAMTLQIFSRDDSFSTKQSKIVQIKTETKFSYEWVICTDNELFDVQVMKRAMSKSELKRLSSLCAGELINYQVDRTLEDKKLRIILKPT